jgi:lipid-binding SYLF domain-containing protein
MKLIPMTVAGLALLAFAAPNAFARTRAEIDADTATTLQHFFAMNPANKRLADKAAGFLVFPRVTKGGVGVGGEFGEGELKVKGATNGYYSIGSASLGLTLGVAKHREIIMFMTPEALEKFTSSAGWSIGADTAIALVKTGAGGQYDSETLDKPVLAFVFGEKGLIGDLSLEGTKVTAIKTGE